MSARAPAVFIGHGSPLNALADNDWTRAWAALGARAPRPRAILAVSAHWYVPAVAVTAMNAPRTIHDFGGFPRELYAVSYPARGDAVLAARVQELLSPLPVAADETWGLDHGTWSVLCHVYPRADVPVVQLSIDARQAARFHYELGTRLGPLRDEGILIFGSGNVVHNLGAYSWGRHPQEPFDWALRFEAHVRERLEHREDDALIDYGTSGRDARLAVPTPEHYLPLLYVLGASHADERPTFPVSGITGGSISMLAASFG
jgi:4,5-DOPA dioxygenase extradiol